MEELTQLQALQEPEVWNDYLYEKSSETNKFIQSGIMTNDQVLGSRLLQPGRRVELPYLNDLTGELGQDDEWNDENDIKTSSLTSGINEAIKLYETKAYAATDFGQLISGANVTGQIQDRFADWWLRQDNQRLINVLKIMFLNQDIAKAKSLDVGNEKEFDVTRMLQALSRIGDVSDSIKTVAVNSAVAYYWQSKDIIPSVQPSTGKPVLTYNGLQVVTDDRIPLQDNGATIIYMFGQGAVSYASQVPTDGVKVVRDEFKNGGTTSIINKRVTTMQVLGTTVDASMTNPNTFRTDLIEGTKPIYKAANDMRKINVVAYGCTIPTDFGVKNPAAPAPSSSSSSQDLSSKTKSSK